MPKKIQHFSVVKDNEASPEALGEALSTVCEHFIGSSENKLQAWKAVLEWLKNGDTHSNCM